MALDLFRRSETIASRDVGELLGVSPRTARNLMRDWVEQACVAPTDRANKSRKYRLAAGYLPLLP